MTTMDENTTITTAWPCDALGLRVGDVVSIPFEPPRRWYARLWRQLRWKLFRIPDKPKCFVVTEISSSGDCMSTTPAVDHR